MSMHTPRLKDERGVAMVTVLFVAATLTVVASAGAFVAVEEFKASRDDRTGVQSLGYAEAGIDQLLIRIKGGSINWGDLGAAGCTVEGTPHPAIHVEGVVAGSSGGTYDAELVVYDRFAPSPDDRLPPASCPDTFPSPRGDEHFFAITSVGRQPAATRVVRQVLQIRPVGLPIGIYAFERVDGNGTTEMKSISMITEGVVEKRDQFGFEGTDPYYTLDDFYGNGDSTHIPAAVHARGQITYGPASKLIEHREDFEPNCEANSKGTAGQSLWDGSGTAELDELIGGCANWLGQPSGPPPTSKFDDEALTRVAPQPNLDQRDYQALAAVARSEGLYCWPNGNALKCTKEGGAPFDVNMNVADETFAGLPDDSVVFFDFPTAGDPLGGSKEITVKKSFEPCGSKSVVLVVRNGSISMEGTANIVGAMLVPEGRVTNKGTFTMHGTIIARRLDVRGIAKFELSECWVNSLPGPFLDVVPAEWQEIDR